MTVNFHISANEPLSSGKRRLLIKSVNSSLMGKDKIILAKKTKLKTLRVKIERR